MNSVAIDLGFIQIYWYSIFILLAMFCGCTIIFREIKKHKINQDFMVNLIFYGIIFGLIGARLYYVAFNWGYYSQYPLEILETWNGGLAIHGAILFGGLWILIYTKKYKVRTMKIFDIAAPALLLGQAIGRWGNFFNQEAFGQVTSRAALEKLGLPDFIINGMNINGLYYQPMFIYESIWNLTGFIALLLIKKYKYLKIGQLSGFYLMWYSAGRFVIESFRSDSLMLGNFKMAQIISIVLFAIGIIIVLFSRRGSHLENLYSEPEKEEIRF